MGPAQSPAEGVSGGVAAWPMPASSKVGGEGHRLGVEVAAGNHLIGLTVLAGEYQRVVRDGIGLDQQAALILRDEIVDRAHHLGLATQAVGVLHLVVIVPMRLANLAASQQLPIQAGRVNLSWLSTHLMDTRIKRRITAFGGVHTQGSGQNRIAEQGLGAEQAMQCQGRRHLRAIDQS